jgi:hypothetical protein
MRLFSLVGAASVSDGENTHTPDKDGGFTLEDGLAARLHATHVNAKPMWETEGERQTRHASEEDERRRDPATLLDAVERLISKTPAKKG